MLKIDADAIHPRRGSDPWVAMTPLKEDVCDRDSEAVTFSETETGLNYIEVYDSIPEYESVVEPPKDKTGISFSNECNKVKHNTGYKGSEVGYVPVSSGRRKFNAAGYVLMQNQQWTHIDNVKRLRDTGGYNPRASWVYENNVANMPKQNMGTWTHINNVSYKKHTEVKRAATVVAEGREQRDEKPGRSKSIA
ncbi:uncharacterized protein LOC100375454 [Saccoglossus kowalevskii]|uniref:Uncharacterized protein LOC100375454 n=1 Tax=Saccoglossus kowalevskii TaxID=10224 RepID=A0ABM0H1G7_SACKO|nr:PREDICTED: uncharacterized protein LOC100375454 [Saccoglossus kowalevskii]